MPESPRVFILDDNPGDRALIRQMLAELKPATFEVEEAWDLKSALRAGIASVDVLFLDLNLPGSRGLNTLTRVQAAAPKTRIIVVTGAEDEKMAADLRARGVEQVLVKGMFDAAALSLALQPAARSQE